MSGDQNEYVVLGEFIAEMNDSSSKVEDIAVNHNIEDKLLHERTEAAAKEAERIVSEAKENAQMEAGLLLLSARKEVDIMIAAACKEAEHILYEGQQEAEDAAKLYMEKVKDDLDIQAKEFMKGVKISAERKAEKVRHQIINRATEDAQLILDEAKLEAEEIKSAAIVSLASTISIGPPEMKIGWIRIKGSYYSNGTVSRTRESFSVYTWRWIVLKNGTINIYYEPDMKSTGEIKLIGMKVSLAADAKSILIDCPIGRATFVEVVDEIKDSFPNTQTWLQSLEAHTNYANQQFYNSQK